MTRRTADRIVFSRTIDRIDRRTGGEMADESRGRRKQSSRAHQGRRRFGGGLLALLAFAGSLALLPSGPVLAEARLGDPIPTGISPLALAANPATNRVYTGNLADETLTVIDGITNTAARTTIPIGARPDGMVINPVTNRIYAADFDASTVTVIDAATQRVIGTPISVGNSPQPIAVDPTRNRIYVASLNDGRVTGAGSVSVINGETNEIVAGPIEVGRAPRGIGVDTTLNQIYVSGDSIDAVTVIDGTSNTVRGTQIPVGKAPQTLAVNSDTHRVYVLSSDDATVTVINSATNAVVGSPIKVGNFPEGIALNPALNLIYVANTGSNSVSVIDGATNMVVGLPITVPFPSVGIDVLPATGRVYASDAVDSKVFPLGVPLTIEGNAATSADRVTATWSSIFVPNAGDFVGLFEPGAPNASPLSRVFTNGTPSAGGTGLADGSVSLPIPAGLVAGHTYDARLVSGRAGNGTLNQVQTALLVAANDTYTTGPTGTLSVQAPGVLVNDSSPRSSPLKATVVTNPAHGTLSLQPDGSFSYTPAVLFSGGDSFTYRAFTDSDLPAVATVAITVTAAPVAANDAYSVQAGSVLTVPAPGLLANDTDADSPTLRAAVGTNPAHGTLALQPDGSFTYTPVAGFSGTDTFTYLASDQTSVSLPATVTITITSATPAPGNPGSPGPGNAPPTAGNDAFTTSSGVTLNVPAPGVLANDSDPDSRSMQAVAVTGPAHGSLTLQPSGAFTYTPNAEFAGADSFTYAASDGSAQSSPATATIFVSPTECAPRPRVQAAPTAGGGKLQVHIESTPLNTHAPNPLRVLRFGTFQNARVSLNGQPITSGQTFTVPSSSAVDFTVERVTPGQATTVPLTIVDGCGEWPTFVGGGPEAGF